MNWLKKKFWNSFDTHLIYACAYCDKVLKPSEIYPNMYIYIRDGIIYGFGKFTHKIYRLGRITRTLICNDCQKWRINESRFFKSQKNTQ